MVAVTGNGKSPCSDERLLARCAVRAECVLVREKTVALRYVREEGERGERGWGMGMAEEEEGGT